MPLVQELRQAARSLRRRPRAALWALSLLALAIGANGALFGVVRAVLLRPLPYADPDRLVWIWSTRSDRAHAFFSLPDVAEYRERARTLRGFAALADWNATLTGRGDAERIPAARVSAEAFALLGVRAQLGRLLQADDDAPDAAGVVLLSDALWRARLGGGPDAVGADLVLDGESRRVVGVLPPGVRLPGSPDAQLFAPLSPARDPRRLDRGTNFLRAFGRLAPGATLAQARAELAAINESLVRTWPVDNAKKTAPLIAPLHDELTGGYRAPLWLLLTAVGLVLLIACFNLGNVLLARATARRHELAVRAALGATRAQLSRELLAEAALLAAGAAAAGLLLAQWGCAALLALAPGDLPVVAGGLDASIVAYVAACAGVAALTAGLLPLPLARVEGMAEALSAARASAGRGPGRLRAAAVIVEVALSVAVLVSAALLGRSFARALAVDPGFHARDALAVRLSLPLARHGSADALGRFALQVEERLRALPGVRGAGLVSILPVSGLNARTDFTIVGRPPATEADKPSAQSRFASPGYFAAIGLPLHEGRAFTALDAGRSLPVAVVDELFARRHFPQGGAVGARLLIEDTGSGAPREATVVGVVGPVHHDGLDEPASPTLYTPLAQAPLVSVAFLAARLFAVADGPASADAVAREIHRIDREVPVYDARSLSQRLSGSLAPRRFALFVLAAFGAAALALATLGIAAVVSLSVAQRTREIGIRRALGATSAGVLRMVVGQAMRLCAAGVCAGAALAAALGRLFSSMLFGVGALDLPAYAGVAALLLASAALGALWPARAATRIDPLEALRAA